MIESLGSLAQYNEESDIWTRNSKPVIMNSSQRQSERAYVTDH